MTLYYSSVYFSPRKQLATRQYFLITCPRFLATIAREVAALLARVVMERANECLDVSSYV